MLINISIAKILIKLHASVYVRESQQMWHSFILWDKKSLFKWFHFSCLRCVIIAFKILLAYTHHCEFSIRYLESLLLKSYTLLV